MIRVAVLKADLYFHADSRQGETAKGIAGQERGDPQPATAFVVVPAFAIPEELHLDPTVVVTVDFLTFRAGDHGALHASDARFIVGQWRAVNHVPGRGEELVAITLKAVFNAGAGVGRVLLQDLRLRAFVLDFGQQPQVVPFFVGVFGQWQEVSGEQHRLIAFASRHLALGAVTLLFASTQQLAAITLGKTTGVLIILKIRLSPGNIGPAFGLQQNTRFFEVVIAASGAMGAGFHLHVKVVDRRRFGDQAIVVFKRCRTVGAGKYGLVVAEHHHVFFAAVLEVVLQAFFLAEALYEGSVGLPVLNAVLAIRVNAAQLKLVEITMYAVAFEHLRNDLRDGHLLKNAAIGAVIEVRQSRHQRHAVAGQAIAETAFAHTMNLPVNAIACVIEGEEGQFVQQVIRVQVAAVGDQFDLKGVRLADAFLAGELEHLQVVFKVVDREAETGALFCVEHPGFLFL